MRLGPRLWVRAWKSYTGPFIHSFGWAHISKEIYLILRTFHPVADFMS